MVADVAVRVFERVVLNRDMAVGSGWSAAGVAIAATGLLDRWSPQEFWTPFQTQQLQVVNRSPLLVYEVVFKTSTLIGLG